MTKIELNACIVNEILNILEDNDKSEFETRCINVGKKIHDIGGHKALIQISSIIMDILKEKGYSFTYLHELSEMEYTWTEISSEYNTLFYVN